MTQQQNKELAEWYGLELKGSKTPYIEFPDKDNPKITVADIWQPDTDSNQLDLLEDKMVKELGRLEMQLASDGAMGMVLCWHSYIQDGVAKEIKGKGKTKNEARLNAIYNYVKGLNQ